VDNFVIPKSASLLLPSTIFFAAVPVVLMKSGMKMRMDIRVDQELNGFKL
jgi:hypothetical protein